MPSKPDPAPIAAEALAGMLVGGGTAAATAAGAPVVLVGMVAAAVNGIFKYLIARMSDGPDPKHILERIRDERTAHTVATIRDALVEAMGLAEASCDDDDRATGFLTCLVMSAAASNTGGALKALLASEHLPQLRPLAKNVKSRIEEIAEAADPSIRLRLQMSLTLLDQL